LVIGLLAISYCEALILGVWLAADSVPPSPRNILYGQLSVLGDVRAILNDEGFVEEERQLLKGVRVRAATVAKLVALVVDCFGTFGCVLRLFRHSAITGNCCRFFSI